MNIGIVTTWYERGAAYVSRAYMAALQNQGNKVYIYARGGDFYARGNSVWDLENVTYSKEYKPLNKKYQILTGFDELYVDMVHFEKWLQNHNIDVVIFNEEHGFNTVKRVKNLGYIVGAYIDYYTAETIKNFSVYDFLLCNTQRHYSVFCNHPNCWYIPWGTDLKLFKAERGNQNIQKDSHLVFFHSAGFGGINNRKGTDLVLKAFQKVKGAVKLIIHSQVPVMKYGKEASELIKHDNRIIFIEKTVPAPGLYHLGDVFVYPSRLEGIGLCIPEALACGLPVITTDNAPMNEFVKDNENGLLVKVKEIRKREDGYYWPEKIADIDDLANKMQTYANDRNLLMQHKRQSRESAEKCLDWLKNAKQLSEKIKMLQNTEKRKLCRPHFYDLIAWWTEARYVTLLTYMRKQANQLLKRDMEIK